MSIDSPPAKTGFDVEATRLILEAFERAWTLLQERDSELVDPERSPATRAILARRIIEMAGAGPGTAEELCDDALRYLDEHRPLSQPA